MDQLIQILANNARLSAEQLAAMTGSTPAQVAARIDALQAEGVIRGYKAVVDWEKTDRDFCTARIELKVTPKSGMGFDEIAVTIAQFDEVESVELMSGGYDLGLTVTGKTFKDVAMFVAQRLAPLDSVESTATHFVLKTYKQGGIMTCGQEKDEREGA
ncbi:MAG: Lrp/AsnC family transcriptional regulator [Angelakisella sp.]|jgi:DNA-binding Lrp family transcriptional regulator|nr:Lrp/AsnC family transcriptional regulator [Angelakisella sp.]MCI9529883.1 Lrp/AsnC family transcriptional regulator [Angelakisella sp.]